MFSISYSKKTIRIITLLTWKAYTALLCYRLKILPIFNINDLQLVIFMYSATVLPIGYCLFNNSIHTHNTIDKKIKFIN